jgi:hypothetical protein
MRAAQGGKSRGNTNDMAAEETSVDLEELRDLRDRVWELEAEIETLREGGGGGARPHKQQADGHSDALADEERERIEEQVLNDLAAHETVEYITSLEVERDEYRRKHAEEVRRVRQLQSSLEAQKRMLAKQQQQHLPNPSSFGASGGSLSRSGTPTTMDSTAPLPRTRPSTAGTPASSLRRLPARR